MLFGDLGVFIPTELILERKLELSQALILPTRDERELSQAKPIVREALISEKQTTRAPRKTEWLPPPNYDDLSEFRDSLHTD